jgi:hybrid cluster-associated redox disulfide protein|tara:strand:+ start:3867 stop:4070 length:204 start_codon:yes stop_codon:yes gene_type:complete
MKITKDTTLEKVLEIKEGKGVLTKHNVPCVGCPMAQMEMNVLKLRDICKMYGIDLNSLLKDLNKLKI